MTTSSVPSHSLRKGFGVALTLLLAASHRGPFATALPDVLSAARTKPATTNPSATKPMLRALLSSSAFERQETNPSDGFHLGRVWQSGTLGRFLQGDNAVGVIQDLYEGINTRSEDIAATMSTCEETCNGVEPPTTTTVGEKPSCCKGGISALKMTFEGPERIELLLPAYAQLTDFIPVDSCASDSQRRHGGPSASSSFVKFVSCDHCFPTNAGGSEDSCDLQVHASQSTIVEPGEEVCLASVNPSGTVLALDTKFPTNMDLFYRAASDPVDLIYRFTLHTSCSKPIYYPFAVRLEACSSDLDFIVDTTTIEESELLAEPTLSFVDGVPAKFPDALLTDCPETCCKGGVSQLKTRVGGFETAGILTFSADGHCNGGYDRRLESSLGRQVRFVSCDDACLNPFDPDRPECVEASETIAVEGSGAEICFGVWDEQENRIAWTTKMPTNLLLFFVPNDPYEETKATEIHTSCSKPVYPPYGTVFGDNCDPESGRGLVNLDIVDTSSLPLHLAFLDGYSVRYLEAADDLNEDGRPFFSVNFADCGCNCTDTPSLFPSAAPSVLPTPVEPSGGLTPAPTPGRSSGPPGPPTPSPSVTVSASPTRDPTALPTPSPSAPPTPSPSVTPSVTASASPSPDPTALPTRSPSVTPTLFPSELPTPVRGSNPGADCQARCESYVATYCDLEGDDGSLIGPCVPFEDDSEGEGEGRLLLESLMAAEQDLSLNLLSPVEKLAHYDKLVELYAKLAEVLE